ncbi:MAG: hypothetical protein LBR80_13430 [Deltaproteobacteria bacterium]|nr:hypothetical protein [Deltaproteobacteria bacterium]
MSCDPDGPAPDRDSSTSPRSVPLARLRATGRVCLPRYARWSDRIVAGGTTRIVANGTTRIVADGSARNVSTGTARIVADGSARAVPPDAKNRPACS